MTKDAEKIVNGSSQALLNKANAGTLYARVEIKDLESATNLYKLIFGNDVCEICDGVHLISIEWDIHLEREKLRRAKERLLEIAEELS